MNRSFYNGVAGIKTHQYGIDVWANNIANENAVGFKENIPEFENQFSQALNTAQTSTLTSEVGLGSAPQTAGLDLQKGALIDTGRNFDTALSGNGWYGFQHGKNTYYTKVGAFFKDENGDLVNSNGEYLLGTSSTSIKPISLSSEKLQSFGQQYTSNGTQDTKVYTATMQKDTPLSNIDQQSKIHLPDILYIPPKPTKNIKFGGNLNVEVKSEIDKTTGKEVAKSSDHFTTSLTNADGSDNILDMTFTKQFPDLPNETVFDAKFKILKNVGTKQSDKTYDPTKYFSYPHDNTLYQIVDAQVGSLRFNGAGALIKADIPSLSNEGNPVALNLGTPLSKTPNSGYDGMTAVKGLGHEAKYVNNDGKKEGVLKDYSIISDGNIVANFSNGESTSVAKIAVYHFRNEAGLQKIDGNMFAASANSGAAIFYQDGNGNNIIGDTILTGKLENSNVQLSNALTELIVMQKAFDASAKSITTSDQMIQKAINMKR